MARPVKSSHARVRRARGRRRPDNGGGAPGRDKAPGREPGAGLGAERQRQLPQPLYEDPALREFFGGADVVFCDGAGVMLAARILGQTIPARITYADWAWRLAAFAEAEGLSLFLLGARPGRCREGRAKAKGRASRPRHRRGQARLLRPRGWQPGERGGPAGSQRRERLTSCSSAWGCPSRSSG